MPTPPTREGFNLAWTFDAVADALATQECFIWGDRRLTYADLQSRSRRVGSYLHDRGLGIRTEREALGGHESGQDHLALALYNGNEYLEGMLGAYRARVAPFNVNYRYVGEELRTLLEDGHPRALMYHASLAPVLAPVVATLPWIEVLLHVGDDSGETPLPGAVRYEDALAAGDPAGPDVIPSPDDLYILYTGGTTGSPKGVLWRQHDIFLAAMGGRKVGSWEVVADYGDLVRRAGAHAGHKLGLLPPLMHGAAQWAAFMLLADGATIVLPDDPRHLDPADIWRTVERERIASFTIVGDAMLRPILDELARHPYDTSSVIAVGNGGAPLSPTVRALALELLPGAVISDSAGSSETGAQMHAVSKSSEGAGRFRPGPGTVVVDEDLQRVLVAGHEGMGWLAQTGPIPLGYLGDAPKTAATFPVVDGVRYAIPGDRARHLESGQIELLGRDSVTINSGGEKIFAEEVERALIAHPAVADVVVTGRPSERWGQEVVAVVALAAGRDPSDELTTELVERAGEQLARYKLPKDIIYVDAVVRSPSGKADYRWAKEQLQGRAPTP